MSTCPRAHIASSSLDHPLRAGFQALPHSGSASRARSLTPYGLVCEVIKRQPLADASCGRWNEIVALGHPAATWPSPEHPSPSLSLLSPLAYFSVPPTATTSRSPAGICTQVGPTREERREGIQAASGNVEEYV